MSINKVILLGNVGRVESKEFGGNKVVSFSVATSERYKGRDGEYVEDTTWHNVKVWGKTADFVENYVGKGSQVFVEGKLAKRKYTDRNGEERESVEVRADNVQLIGQKQESRQERPAFVPEPRPVQKPAPKPVEDLPYDDLPF